MTRVILVRHGQTEWNRVERFRGRVDLALNQTGLAQAHALAERLADWPIAALYSSPLRRAIQTAQPVAERLGLPVQLLPGIVDINYGDWQAKTPAQVAEAYPDLYRRWLEEPHLVRFPHGESLDEVRDRAMAALREVVARHRGQVVLLVAHQVVNRVLVCAMLGLDNSHFWRIRQDNGCINVFDHQDGLFTAVLINDTCHLGASPLKSFG
ncbi:MAG TPA: histidine phosphatase family protein [Anaerolineae bacterium]|nr:histidine phosphatase family protein [Anaerolineae bacterium]